MSAPCDVPRHLAHYRRAEIVPVDPRFSRRVKKQWPLCQLHYFHVLRQLLPKCMTSFHPQNNVRNLFLVEGRDPESLPRIPGGSVWINSARDNDRSPSEQIVQPLNFGFQPWAKRLGHFVEAIKEEDDWDGFQLVQEVAGDDLI